jgi:hypothetical protein
MKMLDLTDRNERLVMPADFIPKGKYPIRVEKAAVEEYEGKTNISAELKVMGDKYNNWTIYRTFKVNDEDLTKAKKNQDQLRDLLLADGSMDVKELNFPDLYTAASALVGKAAVGHVTVFNGKNYCNFFSVHSGTAVPLVTKKDVPF